MLKRNLNYLLLSFFLISITFQSFLTVQAQNNHVELYTDKNGYFSALIPKGWKREDYPSETIRSKVIFHHPVESRISILIIAAPIGNPDYTFDDYYKDKQQNIAKFRHKYPYATTSTTKGKVGNFLSIIQRFSIPNLLEQEIVMLLSKGIQYSISLGSSSRNGFESNYQTFQRFVQNFIVMETDRKFSNKDILASNASAKKRLAEFQMLAGNIEEALRLVDEGLAMDPDNKELSTMKRNLQSKKGKN